MNISSVSICEPQNEGWLESIQARSRYHFSASQDRFANGSRVAGVIHLVAGALLLFPLTSLIVYAVSKIFYPHLPRKAPEVAEDKKEPSQKIEEDINPEIVWAKGISNALKNPDVTESELRALVEEGAANGWLQKPFKTQTISCTFLFFLVKFPERPQTIRCLQMILEKDTSFLGFRENWVFGNTPLIWAIANANNTCAMEMIRRMKKSQLDLEDRAHKNTALHLAIGKGYAAQSFDKRNLAFSNAQLVREMVRRGAGVNICNDEGNTPLHLACMRRDPEMIRTLLEAGANPLLENREGKTSLQLIELEYEQAHEQLRKAVGVFLLDKVQRGENFEEAKRLFKPPGASARA